MSEREVIIIQFRIEGGIITEARETGIGYAPPPLTDPRDIEDAVARVSSTPVGGEGRRVSEDTVVTPVGRQEAEQ